MARSRLPTSEATQRRLAAFSSELLPDPPTPFVSPPPEPPADLPFAPKRGRERLGELNEAITVSATRLAMIKAAKGGGGNARDRL